MTTTYEIQVVHVDRGDWLAELRQRIAAELERVGLHRTVTVGVLEGRPSSGTPAVTVYFGSTRAAADPTVASLIAEAFADGRPVVPVVEDLGAYNSVVPPSLSLINGFLWRDGDLARGLALLLLEELGIEERQRRVFISHKRDDGLGAAEQLHDQLTHHGFIPFIDRFAIPPAARVQARIADALEDHAFLLLLETPLAHTSDWVFDEVDYALSHTMGMLVLQWPGNPEPVPGSKGLSREPLESVDLVTDSHGYEILTDAALDRVVAQVEMAHAQGLVRRRRMLIRSIEEAAIAAGCSSCIPTRSWRLLVEHEGKSTLVGTTPRLPTATDLQDLDQARNAVGVDVFALLIHSARMLSPDRREHLIW
ncbi:MAG TPA: toll/interleukin-1 receptor domain-containing protein, partial [Acidimicrobiales bacterium]|nr:toll/interleukin-1 receptor domain-containing protein [Acidimicrobiales bacterium]